MSTVVWLTVTVEGGLVWASGEDVVGIDEYEVMLGGSVSVSCEEIVFVMARLRLRLSHAALEGNEVK